MKNFVYTSLSLYMTTINITLIIISNCSLLNPGPIDPKTLNVYYQNVQGLITFSTLGSADPMLNMTKLLELNSFITTHQPDVIVLNETWLKDKKHKKFQNYSQTEAIKFLNLTTVLYLTHLTPTDSKKIRSNGGGVMLLIAINCY